MGFAEGRGAPPERVADMAVGLVSGRADSLTGRYFLVNRNLDEIIEQADDIIAKDLLTLRIRN